MNNQAAATLAPCLNWVTVKDKLAASVRQIYQVKRLRSLSAKPRKPLSRFSCLKPLLGAANGKLRHVNHIGSGGRYFARISGGVSFLTVVCMGIATRAKSLLQKRYQIC